MLEKLSAFRSGLPGLVLCTFLFLPGTAPSAESYVPDGGRAEVARRDLSWTDAARKREVPVRIYAPRPAANQGTLPVVVFSHGGGESRDAYGYLGTALARNGYIAVFLTHKGSDRAAVDKGGMAAMGRASFKDRPGDVSFAVDQILSANPGSELLKGRVDSERLAVAGQCAGSTTAFAIAGLTTRGADGRLVSYRDKRIKVVVALSPQVGAGRVRRGRESLHDKSWASVAIPALVVTGTRDFTWMAPVRENPRMVRKPYDTMPPTCKYLVEISGAQHHAFTESKPYYPAGKRDPRHHGWIARAAIAFLDGHLKGNAHAVTWMKARGLQSATDGQCKQEHRFGGNAGASQGTASKASSRKPGSTFDFSALDRFLEKSAGRMGGGCSLILIKGDRVIHRKAYGNFTVEKAVPIASSSKWLSGGLIMALVDAGKISLDDKASKYLPYFTGKKAGMTVRQMFSHTTGLTGNAREHLYNTSLTMDQAVRRIANCELKADPGKALFYGGLGMQVAGRISEIATGKPWVQIFKERLGGPLEMKRTTYYAFGATKNPNVAGGVRSCVDDYGNYVTMLLNRGVFKGKRVLSEKAVATMFSNQSGNVKILRHAYDVLDYVDPKLAKAPYGIGCWLEDYDPKTGKTTSISSGGGFGCMPFVDLKRNVAGVFLPHNRRGRRDSKDRRYNDAHRVYYEAKAIINSILDGTALPATAKSTANPDNPPTEKPVANKDWSKVARSIVKRSDKDGDGAMSREEAPSRIAKAFDRIDKNRDGKVSSEELGAVLERRRGGGSSPRKQKSPVPETPAARPGPSSAADPVKKPDTKLGPRKPLYREAKGSYPVKSVALVEIPRKEQKKALQVRVTYPQGKGKCPVLIFSHYAGGSKDEYGLLVDHWASYGYVCILPNHPDSPAMRAGGTRRRKKGHWRNRPEEAAVVLDNLALIVQKIPELRGRLDLDRIGVGGHYKGSLAAGLLAGMTGFSPAEKRPVYKDTRVKAALMISPVGRGQGLTEKTWSGIDVPTLFMTGSGDRSRRTGNPPEWRTEPFKFCAPGNKYQAWVEGFTPTGGGARNHKRDQAIWSDPDIDACVRSCTLAFWDAHLRGDKAAYEYLNTGRFKADSGNRIKVTAKHRTPDPKAPASEPAASAATAAGAVATKISAENFKKAADYSKANKGRAVLVMIDGKIAFERYDNGFSEKTATHLHSATKGFWGPVVAAMIEDGMIDSFDELASKTLPEWKDHPRKSRITLRHLLTLSAGLVQDVKNLQGHDRPTLATDLYKHAIGVRARSEPGAVFQYGPSCYYVVGEIMKRKLAARKQTPLDYLKKRILEPIGSKPGNWVHDKSGNPHIPNAASFTARDWAKFGQWLLQGGKWNGKQIVRKDLLQELVKPSKANPGHGLFLWLNRPGGVGSGNDPRQKSKPGDKAGWIYRGGCPELFAALGAGKCRMYMIPSLNMVVVRQADQKRDRYQDATFLNLLIEGRQPASGQSGTATSAEQKDEGQGGKAAQMLKYFDTNKDGKIALDEIPKRASRLRAGFGRLDADKDGFLTKQELDAIGRARKRR